jgi:hypothetical protein
MVIGNSPMIRNILHESRGIRSISNFGGSFFMCLPSCSCAGSDPFPCGYCVILSLGQGEQLRLGLHKTFFYYAFSTSSSHGEDFIKDLSVGMTAAKSCAKETVRCWWVKPVPQRSYRPGIGGGGFLRAIAANARACPATRAAGRISCPACSFTV